MEIAENKSFWNELCGTRSFQRLGLKTVDTQSIAKFDQWYMDYYPYLADYLSLDELKDKKVLEIGLGFGTVGEKLFLASSNYTGMDYAQNPVDMMNQRITWKDKLSSSKAIQGDARNMPFKDNEFDMVVSIGCLHHTGDTKKSIEEVLRVLKPGGKAVIMLYYKNSYCYHLTPVLYAYKRLTGKTKINDYQTFLRSVYDSNIKDDAAPIVDFVSIKDTKNYFSNYTKLSYSFENSFKFMRNIFNKTFAKLNGKDIYITAIK